MPRATLDLEISRGTTFGPVLLYCKNELGVAVPLAGYSAFAEARKSPAHSVVINLSPVIEADDSDGLITIPEIPYTDTDDIPAQICKWDIILQDADGKRLAPIIGGIIAINMIITQPA